MVGAHISRKGYKYFFIIVGNNLIGSKTLEISNVYDIRKASGKLFFELRIPIKS